MRVACSGEAATTGLGPAIGESIPLRRECYALRYRIPAEMALLRVLRMARVEHHLLIFRRRLPRRRGLVIGRWLPGYLFVHFDLELDPWQALLREAPGTSLGQLLTASPIPPDVATDLFARCADVVLRDDMHTVIPAGSEVEITGGPFVGQLGVVASSRGEYAWIESMVMGRAALRVRVATRQLRILPVRRA
jgi:hypothetical protein